MQNKTSFIDRTNYDVVFFRNVIVGLKGFLNGKIKWYNRSEEHGNVSVHVPIHYSLLGDTRYIMDAFYDDIPGKRVNSNTDQIPRGIIKLDSWAIKSDEYSNPNIAISLTKELDDELIEVTSKLKSVPIKCSFTLEVVVDNEIDIFKAWQSMMKVFFMYKYFSYDYNRLPLQANFNFIGDTDNPMVRESTFGDVRSLVLPFPIEVHTFFPIFDFDKWDIIQWSVGIYNIGDLVYCNGTVYRSVINNNKSNPCESGHGWEPTEIVFLNNKTVNFIPSIYNGPNNPDIDNNLIGGEVPNI